MMMEINGEFYLIQRNDNGYYVSHTPAGRVMADTMAGVVRLIRERQKGIRKGGLHVY